MTRVVGPTSLVTQQATTGRKWPARSQTFPGALGAPQEVVTAFLSGLARQYWSCCGWWELAASAGSSDGGEEEAPLAPA